MKHSKTLIISGIVLLLNALPSMAQDAARESHKGDRLLKCLSIVGLSDAQKADIKRVLLTEKPVMQALAATLKTDAAALKAELDRNPADACAAGAALLKVHADKGAIQAERLRVKSSVEAVLTTDQKAKLAGCLEAHQPPVAAAAEAEDEEAD
ncbi:MAG: hypothetical protein ABIT01_02635 [Thermoanaerobaculia bacterium]